MEQTRKFVLTASSAADIEIPQLSGKPLPIPLNADGPFKEKCLVERAYDLTQFRYTRTRSILTYSRNDFGRFAYIILSNKCVCGDEILKVRNSAVMINEAVYGVAHLLKYGPFLVAANNLRISNQEFAEFVSEMADVESAEIPRLRLV